MLLENEHKVDAQPVPSERSRNARWVAKVAILFTFAWAIYALIETAAPLLAETYRPLLKTPQSIAQYNASDPFGQTLLRIRSSIPAKKPVVILWRVPDSDPHQVNTEYSFWYALVWSSYWLYPHQVQVVMGGAPDSWHADSTVLDVRMTDQSPAQAPPGFVNKVEYGYPGQRVAVNPFSQANESTVGVILTLYETSNG